MLNFGLLLVALQLLNCADAGDVNLMENFVPEKVNGDWVVWKRSDRLIDTSGKCVRATIMHQNGDIFKVEGKWMDDQGNNHADSFFVVDDRSHPARFMFQSDNHRVALSVLGSDYDNYLVAYGMLGPKESYNVILRQVPPDPAFVSEIEAILKKNNVALDSLTVMDQSSC